MAVGQPASQSSGRQVDHKMLDCFVRFFAGAWDGPSPLSDVYLRRKYSAQVVRLRVRVRLQTNTGHAGLILNHIPKRRLPEACPISRFGTQRRAIALVTASPKEMAPLKAFFKCGPNVRMYMLPSEPRWRISRRSHASSS